ncbi:MAG: YfhO family protein [bacterium]|nr:YfhO family protein [bacterium]
MGKFVPQKLHEPLIVILLCMFVITAFFYPAIFQGQLIFQEDGTGSDALDLNIVRRYLAVQSILQYKEFPLWEPKIACGAPLFAESEAGVLYPGILFFFLDNLTLAANLTVLSAILIAMLGSYYWCRCLKLEPWPSGVAALVYALSEIFILQTANFNIIHVIAWLPLSLAIIHLIFNTGKTHYYFALTFIWAMQLLAGHFQMAAICQICCWLYIFCLLFIKKIETDVLPWKILGLSAVSLGLAIALSAVQLLPTKEFTEQSTRSAAVPLDWLDAHSPKFHGLQFLFNPFYSSEAERAQPHFKAKFNRFNSLPYIGILPLLLSCFSLYSLKQQKLIAGLLLMAGFFLLVALGPKYGVYYILWKYMPYISNFRVTVRFAIPLVCIIAVLAAMGTQNLSTYVKRLYNKNTAVLATAAVLSLICLDYGYVNNEVQGYLPSNWNSSPPVLQTLKTPQRIYSPYSCFAWGSYLDYLSAHRGSRGDIYWQHRSLLSPGVLPLWGREAPDDYIFYGTGIVLKHSANMQKAMSELMKKALIIDSPERQLLAPRLTNWMRIQGITHLITPLPLPADWPHSEFASVQTHPVAEMPHKQIYIYALANSQAKLRLVASVQAKTPNNCLNLEKLLGLKGRSTVYESDLDCPASIGNVSLETATNHRLTLTTDCGQDAYLIISNTFDGNWKANVDGLPTPISLTNLAFQSLPVSKGKHRVELRYISPAFELGWKISLTAAIAFIVLWIVSIFRQQKCKRQTN